MGSVLFILNDAPYGNERAYNGLRLAGAMTAKDGVQVRVFLMADAVGCAKAGQKVPEGYYNLQLMLGKVLRKGEVALCGTCMDARGLREDEVIEGARRSTLAQLLGSRPQLQRAAGSDELRGWFREVDLQLTPPGPTRPHILRPPPLG